MIVRALPMPATAATITQLADGSIALSGEWTAHGIATVQDEVDAFTPNAGTSHTANTAGLLALDTAGAWVIQKLLRRLRADGAEIAIDGLPPKFAKLLNMVDSQVIAADQVQPKPPENDGWLKHVGERTVSLFRQVVALFSFIGETALALAGCVRRPARFRWRPVLFNIRTAGFDALPIVGLLSFLLGVVVAYQGADQLRQYGANIFVADLVGLSMLREFAPLITAIIIAGRSGSAYAAQIGTMTVTEEIDAMRTIGIAPLEMLVIPKIIALVIAMPLLTAFADVLGVFGGMIMSQTQLGVSFDEFLERFVLAVSPTAFLIGILKAPVFAVIIAVIGCFQGFLTKGGADSVGRQTTRSVVQSIFLVIVADSLFSVVFSALDL